MPALLIRCLTLKAARSQRPVSNRSTEGPGWLSVFGAAQQRDLGAALAHVGRLAVGGAGWRSRERSQYGHAPRIH